MGSSWADVVSDAPEFADAVRARFTANLHHLLGTVRPNGAPRLSGTEVTFDESSVGLGMMAESRKLHDVLRDPRVEVHCAPIDLEMAAGDAKLVGRVVPTGPTSVDAPDGTMFVLELDVVSLVRVEGEELVLSVWTPERHLREIRRR